MNPSKDTTPLALRAEVKHNHTFHQRVVIVSIATVNVPNVDSYDSTVGTYASQVKGGHAGSKGNLATNGSISASGSGTIFGDATPGSEIARHIIAAGGKRTDRHRNPPRALAAGRCGMRMRRAAALMGLAVMCAGCASGPRATGTLQWLLTPRIMRAIRR
jgi:hypothetical protein